MEKKIDANDKSLDFKEKVPMKAKLAYGFAMSANGLLSGIGLGSINFFYERKVFPVAGVPPDVAGQLIGIAWLLFAVWNAVNDPLLGIIEDRTRSKLGRRVPYLRYGSIIYGLAFILIWFPIPSNNQWVLFFNFLLMLALFDTLYSMIGLITYSLPAEMALTAKERGNIAIVATVIGGIGYAGSFIIPTVLLVGDKSTALDPRFKPIMILIGIGSAAVIYLSSYYIKENKWAQKEEPLGFWQSILVSLKNKPFLIFEVAVFATLIGQTILMTGITYIFQYILVIKKPTDALFIAPAAVILAISILYFQKRLSDWGARKLAVVGSIIQAFGFILMLPLGSSFTTAAIPLTFIAIGYGLQILTQQNIFGDSIDYDELKTKKRRETTYSGMSALFTKPAISIANWLFFTIIGKYTYFTGTYNSFGQPVYEYLPIGILIAFAIPSFISYLISALFYYFFPLDGHDWKLKKAELHERHQQKEKEYLEYLKGLKKG
ncbi:MAG: MFS transporter [Promethearchaeota archaeon]